MTTNKQWYRKNGPEGDVVISTRIRLARNLRGYPFPASMDDEQKARLVDTITAAAKTAAGTVDGIGTLNVMPMENLPPMRAMSLVERHLISPEFARNGKGSALLLSEDESVSLMLNEEDHLRLQVMFPGMAPDEAYRLADELDTRLDEQLHFAFDDRLGYLTQCPTNLGTGMRASLMLHLPALQERGALQQLANTVAKLGLTIRGLYGEGSRSEGAIYQLSNQVSLGISEQAAIENLKGIAAQIIREERAAREQLKKDSRFEDRVWRSLGILCTARLLTGDEFMALISNLRVGVSLGCLEGVDLDVIGGLINDVQPATLMADAGEELEPAQRDALRARIVRERLTPALVGQA